MDLPGTSNSPPLSAARVRSARAQYGHAVDRYLEQLRVGDPPADDLVRAWERMPPGEGQRMLTQAIDHGIESVPDPPAELVALFKSLDHVPFWVDWDRMHLASRKILRNGLLPAMAFTAYAAPHSYFATANRPLAFTEQLADQTVVRYRQTTRFVIEMFMPRNLQRHADGFKLAVVVRIRHARVRRRILQSGQWEHDGRAPQIPLNQPHMAMSAILFSYFVVQGMRRLGGHFTSGEVESVTLTWRYAAHLLGIDSEDRADVGRRDTRACGGGVLAGIRSGRHGEAPGPVDGGGGARLHAHPGRTPRAPLRSRALCGVQTPARRPPGGRAGVSPDACAAAVLLRVRRDVDC